MEYIFRGLGVTVVWRCIVFDCVCLCALLVSHSHITVQPDAFVVSRTNQSEVDTAQYNHLKEELHPLTNRFKFIDCVISTSHHWVIHTVSL